MSIHQPYTVGGKDETARERTCTYADFNTMKLQMLYTNGLIINLNLNFLAICQYFKKFICQI